MTVWLELERHIDKWRRGVVRTVASRTFFISFPLSSQRRGKFRCLPDKRPTGVGDGYHGYNSDVSPLANVDEAWRCWLPLLVDASIEDTSMDGYDGRWVHSNPPFLNLHLTWELQSEVRESSLPGPGRHLVINQKQSKNASMKSTQPQPIVAATSLPIPCGTCHLEKSCENWMYEPAPDRTHPIWSECWTIVLFDRDLVWRDVNGDQYWGDDTVGIVHPKKDSVRVHL